MNPNAPSDSQLEESGDTQTNSDASEPQESLDDTGVDADSDTGHIDEPVYDLTSLRGAAESSGRRVGTALNQWAQAGDPEYLSLVAQEFGGITPENATKWGPLQPSADSWDFSTADEMVNWAVNHDIRIKGHALLWHSQMPDWIDASASEDVLSLSIHRHFETTLQHFGTRIADWDVVNEAFETDGSMRQSVFWSVLGPEYIADAFLLARSHAPEARLFYNDYGIEDLNRKSDAVVSMVADFKARSVPIDGVGLQMHLTQGSGLSRVNLKANMTRMAALGVVVHISEMDVQIRHLQGPDSERLLAQAMTYYDVTAACVETPGCEQIGFWGFTDRYSWIDDWYGEDDPLLYDEDLVAKPARDAVRAALVGESMTGCDESRLVNGDFESGTESWATWGGSLEIVQDPVVSGSHASLSTNRTATWQGPVQSVIDQIGDGLKYAGKAWVRLVSDGTADFNMTLHWTDDLGDHYVPFAWASATADQWTELSGVIDFDAAQTSGIITSANIYVEGPAAGVDFYADDFTLVPVCPEPAVPIQQ